MRTQLHHIVAEMARARGDSPALTFKDHSVSYGELWREIVGIAASLRRIGLERGERVAVYLDKRIETVSAIFGTSAAGGVFVPVNPVLRPKQVAYILNNCNVRVLVTSAERFESAARGARRAARRCSHVVLLGTERQRRPVGARPTRVIAWHDLAVEAPGDVVPEHGVIDIDMAAILYTSGSTGKPKGVVLSHRNLIAGAESVSQYLGNTADDVILAALPLSFDAGFSQLTTAFNVGAHVVLVNYLLAGRCRPAVRQARGHRPHRRCRRCGFSSPRRPGPPSATAQHALLRQHRRAHAEGDARTAARDLSRRPSPI